MPIGRQSYPALNQTTVGYRVLNPQPMDVYLGPWESIGTGNTAGTTSGGVSLANSIISLGVRYQGLQVIIIANSNPGQVGGETLAYKYWYRGGTSDADLVEFSSSGGGGIVGDYVTTFNGLTGAVQGVSAAVAGSGIAVSTATGSVTITNTGVTYISAGSFISVSGNTGTVTITNLGVHSFNGVTGAVSGVTLGGVNTFTELNTFNAGISASGATLGTLVVNNGISAAGGITLTSGSLDVIFSTGSVRLGGGGIQTRSGSLASAPTSTVSSSGFADFNRVTVSNGISAAGGITFNSTANFTAGLSAADATLGTLTTNSGATVGGRLDVGGVLNVGSGVTLETTLDVGGIARFAGGLSAASVYASTGSTFAGPVTFAGITATSVNTGTLATTGLATLNSLNVTNDATVGGTLSVNGNFYVAGTLTTVNESQLLIQDKYLVLGSTFSQSSDADGAGLYVGATIGANALAGICYSNGSSEWSSSHSFDIPAASFYRVGGNNVLASTYLGSVVTGSSLASVGTLTNGVWNASVIGLTYGGTNKNLASSAQGGVAYRDSTGIDVTSAGTDGQYLRSSGSDAPTWASFSALTGLTADRVKTTAINTVGTYYLTFVTGAANSTDLYVDTATGITFDPSTDTLSCVKIEAIVDGGTW